MGERVRNTTEIINMTDTEFLDKVSLAALEKGFTIFKMQPTKQGISYTPTEQMSDSNDGLYVIRKGTPSEGIYVISVKRDEETSSNSGRETKVGLTKIDRETQYQMAFRHKASAFPSGLALLDAILLTRPKSKILDEILAVSEIEGDIDEFLPVLPRELQ